MNERIRELAEQAGADFMRRINYNNLEGEEYEEDAGVIFESNESFEKFAELIVQECMRMCEVTEMGFETHGCSVEASGAITVKEYIKEHFGVEE
jgi:hypothetical protein